MENKKRLVYIDKLEDMLLTIRDTESGPVKILAEYVIKLLSSLPTVNAVPVDNFKLHHIIIDNNGIPEVKLQFGETYMILRGDPVNFREVICGNWIPVTSGEDLYECAVCNEWQYIPNDMFSYCPHCGANMRGIENGK